MYTFDTRKDLVAALQNPNFATAQELEHHSKDTLNLVLAELPYTELYRHPAVLRWIVRKRLGLAGPMDAITALSQYIGRDELMTVSTETLLGSLQHLLDTLNRDDIKLEEFREKLRAKLSLPPKPTLADAHSQQELVAA